MCELLCALEVTLPLLRVVVNSTVDLDRQPERRAVKIHTQATNHLFSTELQTENLSVAEQRPGSCFGGSRGAAGVARGFKLRCGHRLPANHSWPDISHRPLPLWLPLSRQGEGVGG